MNGSASNGSSWGEMQQDSVAVIVIKELACAIVTIMSVVGNGLVVVVVLQTQRMRTITNYLITNMAVVDILYTLTSMPPTFFDIAYYHWASNSFFFKFCCKAINFCHYMLQAASVSTLGAIAADRYFAIMKPLNHSLTKRGFYIALVVIWLISASVASPVLYSYRVIDYNGFIYCGEVWEPVFDTNTASKLYTIVLFVVVYCIPFVAMAFVYTIICNKLWNRKVIGEGRLNQSGKKILESRKKVLKMLVTVLVLFKLCWLPVQIVSLWGYFSDDVSEIPVWITFTCFFVMRAHAAVNPYVYVMFSENFRDGFKLALKCYCCRQPSNKAKLVNKNNRKEHFTRNTSL